jgi:hypothetical protein
MKPMVDLPPVFKFLKGGGDQLGSHIAIFCVFLVRFCVTHSWYKNMVWRLLSQSTCGEENELCGDLKERDFLSTVFQ